MYKFDVITIFPEVLKAYFNASILGRAQKNKKIQIKIHNLRDFTLDKHLKVDDKPYGGGAGMVLMVEPFIRAVKKVLRTDRNLNLKTKIIVFSAKGKQFNQKMVYNLANNFKKIILLTGRYEGVDERVLTILKQMVKESKQISVEETSIGPYVLTDGDVPAMAVISAVARLVPGVIKLESLEEESHFNLIKKIEKNAPERKALEYPHYTRPEGFVYEGKKYRVPKILLSGNHEKIEEWRKKNLK